MIGVWAGAGAYWSSASHVSMHLQSIPSSNEEDVGKDKEYVQLATRLALNMHLQVKWIFDNDLYSYLLFCVNSMC